MKTLTLITLLTVPACSQFDTVLGKVDLKTGDVITAAAVLNNARVANAAASAKNPVRNINP